MSAVQVPDERATRSNGGTWCPECRTYQWIIDQTFESTYARSGEEGFRVNWFDCGHSEELDRETIGSAPGAPSVKGAAPSLREYMRGAW